MSNLIRLTCLLLLIFVAPVGYATTLEELVERGEVKLEISIADEGEYVVGQELTANIEFATQTWFKGANKFTLPEVGNAVVVQRDSFGTNETRRSNGVSWVVQHKRFSIFPQGDGQFEIPAIKVRMKVFVPGVGDVEGEAYTKPLTFRVNQPAELIHVKQWWAAKSLAITESWNKDFENLKPGYSIKRTITIEADGVLAMMLPEINHPAIPGLAHYVKTPQLIDDNTRGNKLGKRIQEIDYVVEESGEVTIPSTELIWFNVDSQQVEYAKLEKRIIQIGELSPQEKMLKFAKQVAHNWREIAFAVLCFIAIVFVWRKASAKRVKPRYQSNQVKRQLARASRNSNARRFIRWAYVYLDWFAKPNEINQMRIGEHESNGRLNDSFDSVFGQSSKPVNLSGALKSIFSRQKSSNSKSSDIDLSMNPKK